MDSYKEYYENNWKDRIYRHGNDLAPGAFKRFPYIQKLVPRKKDLGNVLDVGCGDGTTLSLLNNHCNIEPYGIDISENAIMVAKKRGIKADVSNVCEIFPFEDEYFDIIICSDVLEHVFFPQKTLNEIYRVAKNDSTIIISIPNVGYLQNRIRLLFGKSIFQNSRFNVDGHIRFWTKSSFSDFLNDNGFKIVDSIGFQGHIILNNIIKQESLWSRYMFFKVVKSKKSDELP